MAKLLNTEAKLADDATLNTITLTQWQEEKDALLSSGEALHLFLDSGDTADLIGADSKAFASISINFPKFSDGRGYSAARLLRERYDYTGELRAVGDVLIDQLFFMKRCGFDTFALRDDQEVDVALAAFGTFSVCYQNDVADQRPLFRRR
ncbi:MULTISPECIES: DUF934 domain-containing protein [Thalassolituus]|jgi:uncharacterized protein (DUF934 family)|uniref:Oxidoreductase probably involved in sulfite reduction n=1 Tax=hydrothermal vent metagenome TaxID=652676 RepID=A0A160T819_9ZZZZ|nr:DUF934 domain-containing protein [Thalassolituus oleivorans]APR67081.1 oxidoreductase [Thalassolituus oleivorans]PCI47566.1 MAG: DUF934 domain-containing protein [Oceanospirillales bacterium]PHQ88078.1 MAG: DUF934 domain-containing protein [Thalassobium sp.]